jgi:DNA (cytosine-5)-methyltransferase 1
MTKSNDDTRNRSTSIRDQLRGHTGRNDLTRPLCPYGARGERAAEFYEFFAGGGMVRAGLGPSWSCLFANDFDPKKAASYAANWGVGQLRIENIANITDNDLTGSADLAWASFPCQDLSLAGAGEGLKGDRSGTFWPFWKLMRALATAGRPPRMIVLENVCGTLTSHEGKDFAAIGAALAGGGYQFGAVVMDAAHFLPQSRPRLFIVAVRSTLSVPAGLIADGPVAHWHPSALMVAHGKLSKRAKAAWTWWRLPPPPVRNTAFSDLIEETPKSVRWHTQEETKHLLSLMSSVNLAKVEAAKRAGRRMVGGIYRRTRTDGDGAKVQRAEIRFDDIAGCLRTPAGGSSRQSIMIVKGGMVRSRLLSPREAARLMGLPEDYVLPENYNEAYHLVGDGVAVPVIRFLAAHILEPILASRRRAK